MDDALELLAATHDLRMRVAATLSLARQQRDVARRLQLESRDAAERARVLDAWNRSLYRRTIDLQHGARVVPVELALVAVRDEQIAA